MSLAILSSYPPAQVARLIVDGDADALRRVRGVGQKTAERLCLELRDQVAKLDLAGAAPAGPVLLPQSSEDAIAALVTLGFPDKEARKKVESATRKAPDAKTETLIKTVLRG